ncbi:MAG: esterase family protein [Acidobacteria bacterium]|nr:esterase family protein [Acidobacteriota bacterium]
MSLAIRELEKTYAGDSEGIDGFLAEHSFPLQEGTTTTFVYRGEAEEVHLLHWIFGLESTLAFTKLGDSDLWYLVMELPELSRVEYKLDVVRDGEHKWIRDPLNPLLAHDPFGANSVYQGVGYETPEWTVPDEEARVGDLEEIAFRSEAFGEERTVQVYLPARYRKNRRYPVLIVHDGSDYLRYAGLKTVLDNLIFRLEIPELLVAMTDSADRFGEYTSNPNHDRFIAQEVPAELERRFPIDPDPSAWGLMGASLGAVATLSAAWRNPGRFGKLLMQSGSFVFTDIGDRNWRGPQWDGVVGLMNAFREAPGRPAERLFVSCGIYESLIYENRSLVPILQATGMDLRYVEARDGHNWENWRDRLRVGLSWLFPGPLWMVYE